MIFSLRHRLRFKEVTVFLLETKFIFVYVYSKNAVLGIFIKGKQSVNIKGKGNIVLNVLFSISTKGSSFMLLSAPVLSCCREIVGDGCGLCTAFFGWPGQYHGFRKTFWSKLARFYSLYLVFSQWVSDICQLWLCSGCKPRLPQ